MLSGKVELAGSGNDANISTSGASELDLVDFLINNAEVKLGGASNATLNLAGRLDANLSGASQESPPWAASKHSVVPQ